MTARDDATPAYADTLAPEAHNNEQDPAGTQAQDVAEDAMREGSHTTSPLESTKSESNDYDPAPDSTGDLIDEMRRMEGEGRIDMSAFAGEPNHDDEPDAYGGETTDDRDGEWLLPEDALLEDGSIGLIDEDDDREDIESLLNDVAGEEEE